MALVSVVLSVYNHEKYVHAAVSSVLAQTFSDFEFILIDNGSTDNSGKILTEFNDPRIRRFHFPENTGGVNALNFGISKATGEYIAFFCSDDIFHLNKLEKQIHYLQNHPETKVVFSQAEIINEVGGEFLDQDHFYFRIFEQENRTRYKWLNQFFHRGNCICFPSAVIHKSVFDNVGLLDPCYMQLPDLDYWIRICLQYEFTILPDKLVKYRVRDNEMNTSGNTLDNVIRNEWEHTRILKNYFSIDSVKELLQIFPEFKQKHPNDFFVKELIPYYIATLCLEKNSPAMNTCALEQISYVLQRNEPLLNQHCQFSYVDFYHLIAKCDIYRATLQNNLELLHQDLHNKNKEMDDIKQLLTIQNGNPVALFKYLLKKIYKRITLLSKTT